MSLLRHGSSGWRGRVVRFTLLGSRVRVGRDCRFMGRPEVRIDRDSAAELGRGVELGVGVELRVHAGARLLIEDDVRVDRGVRLLATNGATLRLRKGARIGLGTVLNGGADIEVGEFALVSGYVYLQTSVHRHERGADIQTQGYDHAPVLIGRDSWIGAHAVVLPGVTVGDGAVVGSNAVVTDDVPAGTIVGGIPARHLKQR